MLEVRIFTLRLALQSEADTGHSSLAAAAAAAVAAAAAAAAAVTRAAFMFITARLTAVMMTVNSTDDEQNRKAVTALDNQKSHSYNGDPVMTCCIKRLPNYGAKKKHWC